jgi:hypothetical protein
VATLKERLLSNSWCKRAGNFRQRWYYLEKADTFFAKFRLDSKSTLLCQLDDHFFRVPLPGENDHTLGLSIARALPNTWQE